MRKETPKYTPRTSPANSIARRVEACLDRLAGKRPDIPDTSETLKKAKRIEKSTERKPELGLLKKE